MILPTNSSSLDWWCIVDNTFQQNFAFGLIGESRISRWLQSRGHMVMPAYEKEIGSGKGPQLYSAIGDFVLPDMLAFRNGKTLWAEAKHKSVWTWHRVTQHWTTGVCLRHYEHYQHVAQHTRTPVWLMFWHPKAQPALSDIRQGSPTACPSGLFGGDLAELVRSESHRSMKWGRHGMVYWARKSLRLLASVADVEQCLQQSENSHDTSQKA